jgi:hypothetical protein
VDGRGHPVEEGVPRVGKNGSHPGADRVALHHGRVSHQDARHVGNRVERPRAQNPGSDTEVASPRPLLCFSRAGGGYCEQSDRENTI